MVARPLIIGHRGAAGHAPENTEAAFLAAVEMGVDAVEFDVQFTADGFPVVFHDETLERMAGVGSRITDYTESVLQCFDIGFRTGPRFRGERVPTLADVAACVPAQIGLHLEIKDYVPLGGRNMQRMLDVLFSSDDLARTLFSSPHEETLADIRKLHPAARTALLAFRGVKDPADAARRADFIGCEAFNPNAALVTPDLVDLCHRHNLRIYAFTVNEKDMMRRLIKMGVDGFFTDYPDRLMAALPASSEP